MVQHASQGQRLNLPAFGNACHAAQARPSRHAATLKSGGGAPNLADALRPRGWLGRGPVEEAAATAAGSLTCSSCFPRAGCLRTRTHSLELQQATETSLPACLLRQPSRQGFPAPCAALGAVRRPVWQLSFLVKSCSSAGLPLPGGLTAKPAPGTAASAAEAVARAAAVASTSAAVFLATRSRIFLRMKWYSCRRTQPHSQFKATRKRRLRGVST